MPTVISKFAKKSFDKLEELGCSKELVSRGLLGTALVAYGLKLSYPYIKQQLERSQSTTTETKCDSGLSRNENNNLTKAVIEDPEDKIEKIIIEKKRRRKKLPGLNIEFILQLKKLIQIMVPRILCEETALLAVHTTCLISRTFLSIYVAAMEGAIVKYIVRKDVKNFVLMLLKWFGIAIPATFINSMIRYLENKLALAFR